MNESSQSVTRREPSGEPPRGTNAVTEANRRLKRNALGRTLALALYSIAVIYFGTRQHLSFPGDELLSQDKVLHALAFGGLGILAYRTASYLWPELKTRHVMASAIGFSSLVGAILELVQATLPYRSMEFGDFIADAIGATICVVVAKRTHLERPLFG